MYVLVRGQLRGEVDDSLRGRARAAATFGVRLESSRPFPTIPVEPDGPPRRRRQLPAGRSRANGDVVSPPSSSPSFQIPVTSKTLAVARGNHDAFFGDADDGRHPRPRPHRARLRRTRRAGRAAARRGRPHTPPPAVGFCFAVAAAGIALAAALGIAVTRATLAPVRRLTSAAEDVSQTLDLSHRIDVGGRGRARPSGRELQPDARDARALRRRPATARRRRVARAPHADHERADEHRAAGAEGRSPDHGATAGARRHARAARRDDDLVAEIFELARGDQQRLDDDDVRLDEIVEDAVRARPAPPRAASSSRPPSSRRSSVGCRAAWPVPSAICSTTRPSGARRAVRSR